MNEPVDHETLQAALALCMLSQDTRHLQQNTDPDTEDEGCVITHVRPVVHRHHPYRRISPRPVSVTPARSRVSLDAEPSGLPESAPVQQPAPARHTLPDRRPSPDQHSLPDQQPSLAQSTSHIEDTSPVILYSTRSLVFQALIVAPAGEWLSTKDINNYIKDKCPQAFEARVGLQRGSEVSRILNNHMHFLEVSADEKNRQGNPNRWRLAEGTVNIMAWTTNRNQARHPPARPQSSVKVAPPKFAYTHRAMTLQALLAAPEGRFMHSSELVDYLTRGTLSSFSWGEPTSGVGRPHPWRKEWATFAKSLCWKAQERVLSIGA